jgi:hypothetical protein
MTNPAVRSYTFRCEIIPEGGIHDRIKALYGEDIEINFKAFSRAGASFDLTGMTASYRVTLPGRDDALLTVDGANAVVSGNKVTVSFNTSLLPDRGEYVDQLWLSDGTKTWVLSRGKVTVGQRVQ